jgi:thymidylate kinase
MFTVALVGPDGAGKTTIARRLVQVMPRPTRYLYMGVNWDASEHLLPTTRLVQKIRRGRRRGTRPAAGGRRHAPASVAGARSRSRRIAQASWSYVSVLNRLAEEWYRQILAWSYVRRGVIVIYDRHFTSDYRARDFAVTYDRTVDRRLHGFLLSRVYPKPDLVIYLDAPPEVLFARKGEGTLESLERRRSEYLGLAAQTPRFVVVDAARPLAEVTGDALSAIEAFALSRSAPPDARRTRAASWC